MNCPHCQSKNLEHLTPITDSKNQAKFYHATCKDCHQEVRIDLDGSVQDSVEHDKSWLDDLSNLVEE
ncbi:hypothetical protein LNTAR_02037 [Lentisphaera araneosa HTCC2155]|uniref:Uncharacterized protein n=1 Tax=Lentisphaera araneosa HTCC2155 TaxID=313628 RepID=A6DP17_9BACT|nr:hypothetical protein [Lentisphaera araneosa]EDM26549.1 hypothetical protein LNTAR_02037 [Lentisphaera araneosa HTCC2155]